MLCLTGTKEYFLETFQLLQRTCFLRSNITHIYLSHFRSFIASRIRYIERECNRLVLLVYFRQLQIRILERSIRQTVSKRIKRLNLFPVISTITHEYSFIIIHLPFDFPIVVKPENSNALDYLRCHFEGQKKVFFFDAREQYLTMVHSMNQSDYRGKLILQEFIPGGDDAMRVLNSYSDLDGHVRAMCLGQPVLEYYDPKSVGNYAAIISRGDQALYDKMQEFLEKLGYVGFSNIDMKYDSRTGRYVLFEINPRLGRSSYFCRAAGLNMMKLLTNDVVYGKREDCVYNHTVALWQNVPTGILRRYVKDQELSDELKQFKGTHTLFCKGDLPLSRLYRLLRYYAAQYHNFRDYYFDKK